MENDDNVMEFYYCTEQFCKNDTTSFIKSNYDTVFTGLLTDQF